MCWLSKSNPVRMTCTNSEYVSPAGLPVESGVMLREVATAGTAVLMATHDDVLARGADRILTLVDGVIDGPA